MKKAIALVLTLALVVAAQRLTQAFGSGAAADDEAIYVVTHVDVIPKFIEEGRQLLKQFVAETRTDPGAIRIEAVGEIGRPNHSTVIEVWKNKEAFERHLAAEHTKVYRTRLGPMLGSPFDERLHTLTAAATGDH